MLLKMIVDTVVAVAVLGLMLFVSAGTLAWPEGWALIIIFIGSGLIVGVWLLKTDPELLAARQKSPLSNAQVPLLLGSLWGLLGIVLILPLLAARALREEAMLFEGLPGYREYADKVRYRFVPGVW